MKQKLQKKIGKDNYIDKTICFIYSSIMESSKTDKVKGTPISEKKKKTHTHTHINKTHIHHSHISGEILGY